MIRYPLRQSYEMGLPEEGTPTERIRQTRQKMQIHIQDIMK